MDILITLPQNLWIDIVDGKKTIELRSVWPKKFRLFYDRVWVVLKGYKLVVGSFCIDNCIWIGNNRNFWNDMGGCLCVSHDWYLKYIHNKKNLYAWCIENVYELEQPEKLGPLLHVEKSPQSYTYIKRPLFVNEVRKQ